MKTVTISVALLFLSLTVSAHAGMVYSIETDSDTLVLIDSLTGNVETVGALSFDATDVDLTMLDGRLYALNSNRGTDVTLYQLNPNDGSTIFSSIAQEGAANLQVAEGLANRNGELVVGYNLDGGFFSNRLGNLAVNGQVTLTGTEPSIDFDGLGVDHATNILYGTDTVGNAPVSVNFFTVGTSPLSANNFLTNFLERSNDIVVKSGVLTSLNDEFGNISRIDLSNNEVTTIAINSSGSFLGLALAVPEPTACLLFSCAIGSIAMRRKRRQKR